eukprot:11412764-Alexandrium_andersonii.AAC.1
MARDAVHCDGARARRAKRAWLCLPSTRPAETANALHLARGGARNSSSQHAAGSAGEPSRPTADSGS